MVCHYLDEMGRFKICRAKGITPPTLDQLRNHCYKSPYDCPVYIDYTDRMRQKFEKDALEDRDDEEQSLA